MKIAVTGSHGQVTSALQKWGGRDGFEIVAIGRPELDLSAPRNAAEIFARHRPDIIVNAAAYTQVDRAEAESDLAFQINAAGAEAVALATADLDVPIIQISTDYVFSGDKEESYLETDQTDPRSVYGASKLDGEQRVASANPNHVILRTSWVYSETGSNFLKTMVRLATERDEVRVVDDQIGAPTHADDIAASLVTVARAVVSNTNRHDLFGTYHMTAGGETSWFGFALEIFAALKHQRQSVATLVNIPTSEYPTAAARPMNSRLRCDRFEQTFGRALPHWKEPVRATVRSVSLSMA